MTRPPYPGWDPDPLEEGSAYDRHSGDHGGFTSVWSPHCYQCVFGKPYPGPLPVVARQGCGWWLLWLAVGTLAWIVGGIVFVKVTGS